MRCNLRYFLTAYVVMDLVFFVKLKKICSDVEAIEWDNMPSTLYKGMETPQQVLASLDVQAPTNPNASTESKVAMDNDVAQTQTNSFPE